MEYTHYDLSSMQPASLQVMSDGEKWLNTADGNSRRVGDEETLIPYSQVFPLLQMLGQVMASARNGQYSDSVPIAIPQQTDSVPTAIPQQTDNNRTLADRQEQTENARNMKPAPEDTGAIIRNNPQIVKLLKNAYFVRQITDGTYKDFRCLPHNCPQRIVDEINARGIMRKGNRKHTVDTVSRVVSAMKVEDRPTRGKVVFLVCLAIVLAVGLTRLIGPSNQNKPKQTTEQTETKQNKIDFDNTYTWWQQKTKHQLTETRLNILRKMISEGKIKTNQELVNEMQAQYKTMLNVTKK